MKILIIRSAPLDQYQDVLKAVLKEHPEADLSVLTHVSSTSDVLDIHHVRIYTYNFQKIHPLNFGWDYIKRLRNEKFDKVVLIYTNVLGQGYEWVRITAHCLGAESVVAYNRKGQPMPLSFIKKLIEAWHERILLVIYFFIWLTFLIKRKWKDARRN